MRRLRGQAGTTLIELLVAMIVTSVVLTATLTAFMAMTRSSEAATDVVESQREVRTTMGRVARELRNMASPGADLTSTSSTLPRAIDRNLPYDLIFKSVRDQAVGPADDANVQRVRYCLDASNPASATLWRMEQPVAAATYPTTTSCPGSGWENPRRVGSHIVNRASGQTRPLFGYVGDGGDITGTDDASRSLISRVRMFVYVDTTPKERPLETLLQSSVLLRNQNREPVARFTVTVTNFTARTVQLNGSQSEDPESQSLTYTWFDNGVAIGDGIVRDYTAPAGGTRTFTLKVKDPAGLEGAAPGKAVTFP